MQMRQYEGYRPRRRKRRLGTKLLLVFLIVGGFFGYKYVNKPTIEEVIQSQLIFDDSFSVSEKQTVSDAIKNQSKEVKGTTTATVQTVLEQTSATSTVEAYVPITSVDSPKQQTTIKDLAQNTVYVWHEISDVQRSAIASVLGAEVSNMTTLNSIDELKDSDVAIVPVSLLTFKVKLLGLDGVYYLDSFKSGAIFRQVSFSGDSATNFSDLDLSSLPSKDKVLKINQTGVTALTRIMLRKLNTVGDPLYFSEKIGDFLSDADITHVSNEVSFMEGCGYSNTVFCSDPRFIETLKDSGVDLVELTGNHNNDVGNQYNTETINLYHSLGMSTVGGGLNKAEAAKFYLADQKQSRVAFLAYNYPDSPNGGAIAGESTAGANSFDFERIKKDIESAKQQAQFVIVDVQYWECYSYPDGYVEFPQCDKPIGEQESVFKQLVDLGADMVVGTQAHQPQTYELHNDKPIYYGLGNLYFDQTSWPGTERGIILTHYFVNGELVQTKLTPTIYDTALQTEVMSDEDAVSFLGRLQSVR